MTQDTPPPAQGFFARLLGRLFGQPAATPAAAPVAASALATPPAAPAPSSPPPAAAPAVAPVAAQPVAAQQEAAAEIIVEPPPTVPPPTVPPPAAPLPAAAPEPPVPAEMPAAPSGPIGVSIIGVGVPDPVRQFSVTAARVGVVGEIVPPRKKLETDAVLPFAPHGPKLGDVRRLLLERARDLGHRMTREPDLRIAVGEAEFRPVETRGQVYVFRFPAGPGAVRLRSRYGVPKRMYPDTMDNRRLGVFVGPMVFADASHRETLGPENPALTEGWWDLENADASPRRWTNGDALLPLTLDGFAGEVTAEITILHTMASWVEEPPTPG
jgi:hypothetical protein